jgi:ribose transport system permease protein
MNGGSQRGTSEWRAVAADYLGMVAVLAALVAVFGMLARNFFQLSTFQTIANQIPHQVLVAVGMTFVLIIGGIDLSVGSVLALSSAVLGVCLVRFGWPLALAIPACLAVGLACGALNGLVTVAWRLPSFIVTLGMLEIARGGAYLVTRSQTEYIGSKIEAIADTTLLALPLPAFTGATELKLSLPFVLALAVVALGQFVLSRTVFGRHLVAIGTNEEAVRLSGIDPRPRKLAVFALCGALTAVAAVIYTSRLASADPNAGVGLELEAIAAVVIGGTSLMGGRGSVVRSFLGVLIIAILGSGLNQLGAQESTKRLITGLVIVAAVIADHYRHRLGAGRAA